MLLLDVIGVTEIQAVAVLMVSGLWRRERVFGFVQLLLLAEWPLLVIAIAHNRVSGYFLWHSLNQFNILLAVVAGWAVIRRGNPLAVAGVGMLAQATLKLIHYALLNRLQEFRPFQRLYLASRWLDLFINLAIVGGVLWAEYRKEPYESFAPAAPRSSTDSRPEPAAIANA